MKQTKIGIQVICVIILCITSIYCFTETTGDEDNTLEEYNQSILMFYQNPIAINHQVSVNESMVCQYLLIESESLQIITI